MHIHRILAALMLALFVQQSLSQTSENNVEDEYKNLIKAGGTIDALGPTPFGESVSLYDGTVTFLQTDANLRGNGLPLSVSRQHRIGAFGMYAKRLGAFADWDWDLPRITTLVSAMPGPQGSTAIGGEWKPSARCSQFAGQPAPAALSTPYEIPMDLELGDWWSGYQLITSEGGTQDLLLRSSGNALAPTMSGMNFPIVTTKHWMISCLSQTSNGQSGEGFLAVSPNGTKYWLDRLVYEQADALRYPRYTYNGVTKWPTVFRMRATMLVTRIEDRFGNWITFDYADTASKNLTHVTTSDGRQLAVQWRSDGPYIDSITLQPQLTSRRTWTYGYANSADPQTARLTSVTVPDGRQWSFNLNFVAGGQLEEGAYPTCAVDTELAGESTQIRTGTITHPSGLVGTFGLESRRHGRSYTPRRCRNGGAPLAKLFRIPVVYADFSLRSKQLAGAGVNYTWNYAYSAPNASFDIDCTSGTCPSTITTTVTEPDGASSLYTFSNKWGETEGKLLQTDFRDGNGSVVRSISTAYAGSSAGPFPAQIGTVFVSNINADQVTKLSPTRSRTLAEAGDTYSWQALAYDRYGNATQIRRSNNIPGQTVVQERITLANDDAAFQSRWVLGQVKQIENQTAGMTPRLIVYNANALPQSRYSFGLKVMDYTWNGTGQLASFADGLTRTISLTDYKLGIPRLITYADSTTTSVSVSDFSEVTSVTDQNGATTGYQYDSMSRLKRVDMPAGDVVAWAPTINSYDVLSGAELGMSAGSWRVRSTTGSLQVSTYYDSLFRPVLTEEKDTQQGTTIYRRKSFDHADRPVFEAYPASTAFANAGIDTTYDVIGRLLNRRTTDSIYLEQRAYLSGARVQVTDGDGRVRTSSYQVFDAPAYATPVRIEDPENRLTVYTRDVFGKALNATQSGTWVGGAVSATRTWEYDTYQRLCRRIEPETGSTVYGFDEASQIVWEAKGQSGTGCLTSAPAGSTSFSYYVSGRKQLDNYPGLDDDTSYTYDPAGNVKSVSNAAAVWEYDYNKRNLVEREKVTVDGQIRFIDPSYDALGNMNQKIFPDGTAIIYAPDAWGRPTQIGSYVASIQYYPTDAVASYVLGNSLIYTQTLDNQMRLHTQETRDASSAIQSFIYGYSNAGDLLTVTEAVDGADNATFTYDGLHRVSTAAGLWGAYGYEYDPLNNIRSRTGPNALSYSYNAATNRLAQVTGSTTRNYSYNDAGEVIGDGIRTFLVNARGQFSCVSGVATYAYDGNAKRIKSLTGTGPEYTFYDKSGALVYSEVGGVKTAFLALKGQTLVELATGNAVTIPKYLHSDWQGSPRKASNAAGLAVWNETFSPFGEKLNGVSEQLGYTGHVQDAESGFTYMQARYYDPLIGRFLSPDPVRATDDFSLFAYVGNNPINKTDPSGQCAEDACLVEGTSALLAIGVLYTASKACADGSDCQETANRGLQWIKEKIGSMFSKTSSSDEAKDGEFEDIDGNQPPFKGEPGSTVRGGTGSRTYGSDGYPETDRDHPHPDEAPPGCDDHCHDWTRPADGGAPTGPKGETNPHRGPPREPKPGDPPKPRGPNVPKPQPKPEPQQ